MVAGDLENALPDSAGHVGEPGSSKQQQIRSTPGCLLAAASTDSPGTPDTQWLAFTAAQAGIRSSYADAYPMDLVHARQYKPVVAGDPFAITTNFYRSVADLDRPTIALLDRVPAEAAAPAAGGFPPDSAETPVTAAIAWHRAQISRALEESAAGHEKLAATYARRPRPTGEAATLEGRGPVRRQTPGTVCPVGDGAAGDNRQVHPCGSPAQCGRHVGLDQFAGRSGVATRGPGRPAPGCLTPAPPPCGILDRTTTGGRCPRGPGPGRVKPRTRRLAAPFPPVFPYPTTTTRLCA